MLHGGPLGTSYPGRDHERAVRLEERAADLDVSGSLTLIAAGAMVAAIGHRDSWLLRTPLLVWAGLLSYSLYLWQTPIRFTGSARQASSLRSRRSP